ncbi:MAG: hypothetical protein KBT20_05200 [Bacteroidales bacterium]|nr:hypothetical protein [Candidatus Liminaster caballi]
MRKILTLLLCALALPVFADDDEQQGGMVLRMDTVKVTDSKLVIAAQSRPAAQEFIDYICDQTRQVIMDAAQESKRFNITDMEAAARMDEEMRSERALDLSEEERQRLMHDNAVKMLASDWLLEVDITQCQLTPKAGGKAYTAILRISIVTKDRKDPNIRIIDTHRFVTDVSKQAPKLRREDAVAQSLEDMKAEFVYHFANHFSIYAKGNGFEGEDLKITAGSNYGVTKGTKFQIFHMAFNEADKTIIETPVGMCEAKQVADNSSICKITKGSNEVFTCLEKGGWIRVKSILKEK